VNFDKHFAPRPGRRQDHRKPALPHKVRELQQFFWLNGHPDHMPADPSLGRPCDRCERHLRDLLAARQVYDEGSCWYFCDHLRLYRYCILYQFMSFVFVSKT
jgi:hypothetical protein